MKYRKILLTYNAYFQKLYFDKGTELEGQNITQQNIRIASLLQWILYIIKQTQIFGVNMIFISSNELKKKNVYFMSGEATNEIYIFSLH